MGAAKKSLVLILAFVVCVCAFGPVPHTFATAHIYQLIINNETPYLIAGQPYNINFTTDKARTTDIDVQTDYSTDNGLTWHMLALGFNTSNSDITFPIDPQLISATIRVGAYFTPLFGSDSYSEKIMGPYTILQPGSIADTLRQRRTRMVPLH